MKIVVKSAICDGWCPRIVEVEASYMRGFAGIQLLGNVSEVCRDGRERARAALEWLGYRLPERRIVINLAPADVRKDGNHLDLPLAVAIGLLLREEEPKQSLEKWLFMAELGLDGTLRPVKGVVPYALTALEAGLSGVVISPGNWQEASALRRFNLPAAAHFKIVAFNHLKDVIDWLYGEAGLSALPAGGSTAPPSPPQPDFDDMNLSEDLELVALAAASGGHNLLLVGAPGTGKTMFATRLTGILTPMLQKEHLEALKIHSLLHESLPQPLIEGRPPFRNPHHSASAVGLLGHVDRPGEISLAHGGVLFLDELPEFRRDLLEALREPLESHVVRVARAQKRMTWDAKVLLVSACNPCPCGWLGSKRRECRCGTPQIIAYQSRLSGPLLDRIPIQIAMKEVNYENGVLRGITAGVGLGRSKRMKQRVIDAQRFKAERLARASRSPYEPTHIEDLGVPISELERWVERLEMQEGSMRKLMGAFGVARTLADLDGRAAIAEEHLRLAWSWHRPSALTFQMR